MTPDSAKPEAEGTVPPESQIDFSKVLREAGLKVTSARLALLKLISSEGRHMTADEITDGLRARGVRVDRVTVYRNIDRMIRDDILIHTHLPGRAMRVGFCIQPEAPHHHHIVCQVCGRVDETVGCCIQDRWDAIAAQIQEQSGFKVTGHMMQYIGICRECRRS